MQRSMEALCAQHFSTELIYDMHHYTASRQEKEGEIKW